MSEKTTETTEKPEEEGESPPAGDDAATSNPEYNNPRTTHTKKFLEYVNRSADVQEDDDDYGYYDDDTHFVRHVASEWVIEEINSTEQLTDRIRKWELTGIANALGRIDSRISIGENDSVSCASSAGGKTAETTRPNSPQTACDIIRVKSAIVDYIWDHHVRQHHDAPKRN